MLESDKYFLIEKDKIIQLNSSICINKSLMILNGNTDSSFYQYTLNKLHERFIPELSKLTTLTTFDDDDMIRYLAKLKIWIE